MFLTAGIHADSPTASPGNASPPRVGADLYGDPLPAGAVARLGTWRFRANQAFHTIAYSPDGKYVATGGAFYGRVHVWEVATGKLGRKFEWYGCQIFSLAFAPNGKTLASASSDGKCRLWSLRDLAAEEQRPPAERKTANSYSMQAPKELPGYLCAYSTDGNMLLTLAYAKEEKSTIHVWEATSGRALRQFVVPFRPAHLALAPDGRTIAFSFVFDEQPSRLWDITRARELHALPNSASVAAFAPDGQTVATGGKDGCLHLWEVATGRELRKLGEPKEFSPRCSSLVYSPNGRFLLCSDLRTVLLEVSSGRRVREYKDLTGACSVSPDGQWVAGRESLRFPGTVLHFWNVATGRQRPILPGHRAAVTALAFSPDDRLLASASFLDGTVRLWETASSRQESMLNQADVTNVSFADQGRYLLANLHAAGSGYQVWELATGSSPRPLAGPLKSDHWMGRYVAIRAKGKSFYLFNALTGKEMRSLPGLDLDLRPELSSSYEGDAHIGARTWIVLNRNGKLLLLFRQRDGWFFWNEGTGKQTALPGSVLRQPSLAADDRTLAIVTAPESATPGVAANQGTVHLLDTLTGKVRLSLPTDPGVAELAVFSPDGHMLAVAYSLHIGLWETMTGKERLRLEGLHRGVASLAFASDGSRLASGSADTTVLIWDFLAAANVKGTRELSREQLSQRWKTLAGEDAAAAYRAMLELAAVPQSTVPFLQERLRPVPTPDPRQVEAWIGDLDSERGPVRLRASAALKKLGDLAEPALRQALAKKVDLEVQRRIEQLLAPLSEPEEVPERIQQLRALEVLERIVSPDALDVLRVLAGGAPASRITQEAQAALTRRQELRD